MGRRTRQRWVKQPPPNNIYFSNIESFNEDLVNLTVAEFEAIRLKHYINLNQKESAEKMNVSQPTFSRILESAHQKMAQALVEGKSINVSGGNFDLKKKFIGYGCLKCDHEWNDETASKDRKSECPECNSTNIYYLEKEDI